MEYDDSDPSNLVGRFVRMAFIPGLAIAHPAIVHDAQSGLYWMASNTNRDALRSWVHPNATDTCASTTHLHFVVQACAEHCTGRRVMARQSDQTAPADESVRVRAPSVRHTSGSAETYVPYTASVGSSSGGKMCVRKGHLGRGSSMCDLDKSRLSALAA